MTVEAGKKSRRLVEEFIIPKCAAKAFELKKGQILKAIAHEGPQVADIKFLNAHDYKEQFVAQWSGFLNGLEGLGGRKKIKKLYSKPPWERVMLTVIDDPNGDHILASSCSERCVDLWPELAPEGGKTCMDLFAEVLRPYGITISDLDSAGTFDLFMPTRYVDDEFGSWKIVPPTCKKGDYIEFRAEMDILVAATSCPDSNEINDFKCKGLKYQIFEEA